jgi:hypothetical protein
MNIRDLLGPKPPALSTKPPKNLRELLDPEEDPPIENSPKEDPQKEDLSHLNDLDLTRPGDFNLNDII